ncbi:hypothetical protein FSP39_024948 [Pinctada imbricata]|uniref:C1q domain-containing protein n=1 Tax=Pinctada imbricata TaxID=66713 RepID=A0AA88YT72_PINIB|nr:hypothetical protein FSP39_024948 [Pinctada imbricata]
MAFIQVVLLVLIRQVLSDTSSDYTTQCPARCDMLKEVDTLRGEMQVLRQLLNQESLLRMSLDQQVQSQKMIIQNMENDLDVLNRTTEIENLRQLLNQESLQRISSNQKLKNELDVLNRKTEDARSALSQRDNGTIAFTVSTSSALSNHNNRRIIYDKVLTNSGNAYNNITGIFTCPAPGNYVFTWSTMSRSSSEYCYAYIYHNNTQLLMSHGYGGSYNEVASNTIVLLLSVGDMVWIQTGTCRYNYGYPYTAFSGWKI